MLANFHTHTTFCDGMNTPEEMVRSAMEKGFDALGFSGHCRTEFDLRYCMKDPEGYRSCIRQLREKYRDKIRIFLGIEEDMYAPVRRQDYDYIIGSAHYVHIDGEYYSVDSGADYRDRAIAACGGDPVTFAEIYYRDFCDYIRSRKPDIIGHFDLITKYDETAQAVLLSEPGYWAVAEKYLKLALEADVLFEVNTGAMARGVRTQPYPHTRLLSILQRAGGRVILSSDSHSAETLDFAFAETKALLRDAGFTHSYTLGESGIKKVDL